MKPISNASTSTNESFSGMTPCFWSNFGSRRVPNTPGFRMVLSLLVIVGCVAASAMCPHAFGQEPRIDSANTSVELDDDGAKDLLAAMKSLDETMNKKDVLEKRDRTRNRLIGIGVLGGAILALLGVLFAYLRLDHATRGFHSGRLQLLAGFISILILVTCYFLWTQVLFQ